MVDTQPQTMSLKAAYDFGEAHNLEAEIRAIRDMVIEWDLSYTSSLRRGYIIALFESNGLFEEFKKIHWPFGDTPRGEQKRSWWLRLKERYEAFLLGRDDESGPGVEDEQATEAEGALEFALEAHLRDFLAKNLDRIEPGLRLHASPDNNGIEFPVDGGRIDILAIDRSGKYVVVELKLSRGRNRALGQLLYYMGWIDQHLGNAPCRGFIIASEITNDLVIAVARVPGVRLAKYRMSFSIEAIRAEATESSSRGEALPPSESPGWAGAPAA